jgi:hypothetical protein
MSMPGPKAYELQVANWLRNSERLRDVKFCGPHDVMHHQGDPWRAVYCPRSCVPP